MQIMTWKFRFTFCISSELISPPWILVCEWRAVLRLDFLHLHRRCTGNTLASCPVWTLSNLKRAVLVWDKVLHLRGKASFCLFVCVCASLYCTYCSFKSHNTTCIHSHLQTKSNPLCVPPSSRLYYIVHFRLLMVFSLCKVGYLWAEGS